MKKILIALIGVVVLEACTDHNKPSGVHNDGIQVFDPNGGLADTAFRNESATDTLKMEHRVGTAKRDTFENQPNQ